MTPEPGPGRELGEGYKYVALGMTFAGGVIMFMVGGWALDRWLGLTPLFTVTGTLAGAVLSFLSVYRKLQAEWEARQRKRDGERP
jgi:F0F1-type ATP synthase assembly protein I